MEFLKLTRIIKKLKKRTFLREPIYEIEESPTYILNPSLIFQICEIDFEGVPTTSVTFANGYDFLFKESPEEVVRLVEEAIKNA